MTFDFNKFHKKMEETKVEKEKIENRHGVNYVLMFIINIMYPDEIDWDAFDYEDCLSAEQEIRDAVIASTLEEELILDPAKPYCVLYGIGMKLRKSTEIPYHIPQSPFPFI